MGRRLITAVVACAMVLLSLPLAATPAAAADGGSGSISLNAINVAYTQDFNSLSNSPDAFLSSVLPNGWLLSESGTGTRNDGKYAVGTGSNNTGDTYAYGTPVSDTDRALGTLRSGSVIPIIGARFVNNTGVTINRLGITYTGEQWRLGTSGRGPDRLDFQYSTTATSLGTGTWADWDPLDFTGPVSSGAVGALNGNLAVNRATLTSDLFVNIPNGATFWIRWTDVDVTSADDGLAVDDLSITPSTVDAPPAVTFRSPAPGATGIPRDGDVTIGFSEPVVLGATWFSIVCATSGSHAASVSSGGTNVYILDPAVNFGNNESCTVTIYASQVTDLDTADPPDNMATDDVFSFQTADTFTCGDPATPIHAVQGSGLSTPMPGATVVVEGIVVGDYQLAPSEFAGFYLEEEAADADADPLTSEGIFVLNSTAAVGLGDLVRVRGTVSESSGLTRLASVTAVSVCSTGNSVTPAHVALPVSSVDDLEAFEGMLVQFDQTLTATEVFSLGRFGEVSLSGAGRLFTGTAVAAPGAAANAVGAQNARSRIILDDGNNQQNIDPTRYPQGGLSAINTLRVGDTLSSLTGVMDYRFGNYRIQPVGPISFAHTNPRTPAPTPVGGNLKVASFNVLNFFNGNGLGGGFPTSRGASSATEFARQRAKEISALSAMNADIIGLMELENDAPPYSAIEDLVAGLNAAMGAGTYSFIDTGVVGTDEIRVGIIYKPASVTPAGAFRTLTTAVDPRFVDTKNRPSLAQTFDHPSTGQRITVVVNHLKSKGSACDDLGDPDTGDGQGNCNITRTRAAQALLSWLATDPTGSGDPDFLLIGDMNSYAREDPITTFTSGGFTNLVAAFDGPTAYSYVFNGESGYLDHALATASLTSQVTGVGHWHINPDEPTVLDYNTEFKTANQITTFYDAGPYRSSDHDPVLIGLQFDDIVAPTLTIPASVTAYTGAGALSCTSTVTDAVIGTATASDNSGHVALDRTGVPAGNIFPLGATTITYTATDAAGNRTSAAQTVTVIDNTNPTITAPADGSYELLSLVPAANAAAATASDNCGGVTVTVVQTNNGGAGSPASPLVLTRTYTATDAAGNTASATQTITVIDDIPPAISGATTTAPNTHGWWNTAVTVRFTCADNSGWVDCPADVTVATEGFGQSVTRTATDPSGNTASATVSAINIDTHAPTITFTGALAYTVDQTVSIGCAYADLLSGIDLALPHHCDTANGTAYSFGVGSHTLTAAATDNAGNTATATRTFSVTADAPSVCAVVRTFVASTGIANSLCGKLDAATAALARGNVKAHDNQLAAFVNEVSAQRGKAISDADATTLVTLAGAL